MKIQSFLWSAASALIFCISACKPEANTDPTTTTPTNDNDFVSLSINNGAAIRYDVSYNTATTAYSAVAERIIYPSPAYPKGLRIMGGIMNFQTQNIDVIDANVVLPVGSTFTTGKYPTENTGSIGINFTQRSRVGTDTTVTSYIIGSPMVVADNYIKFDQIKYDSLGVVKGSFYFKNVEKKVKINSNPAIITSNQILQGNFKIKCGN